MIPLTWRVLDWFGPCRDIEVRNEPDELKRPSSSPIGRIGTCAGETESGRLMSINRSPFRLASPSFAACFPACVRRSLFATRSIVRSSDAFVFGSGLRHRTCDVSKSVATLHLDSNQLVAPPRRSTLNPHATPRFKPRGNSLLCRMPVFGMWVPSPPVNNLEAPPPVVRSIS